MDSFRDAAWESICLRGKLDKRSYDREMHRNNAIVVDGWYVKMTKDLQAGEEILLGKGWSYYQTKQGAKNRHLTN